MSLNHRDRDKAASTQSNRRERDVVVVRNQELSSRDPRRSGGLATQPPRSILRRSLDRCSIAFGIFLLCLRHGHRLADAKLNTFMLVRTRNDAIQVMQRVADGMSARASSAFE